MFRMTHPVTTLPCLFTICVLLICIGPLGDRPNQRKTKKQIAYDNFTIYKYIIIKNVFGDANHHTSLVWDQVWYVGTGFHPRPYWQNFGTIVQLLPIRKKTRWVMFYPNIAAWDFLTTWTATKNTFMQVDSSGCQAVKFTNIMRTILMYSIFQNLHIY